jgi:hypothetical protein
VAINQPLEMPIYRLFTLTDHVIPQDRGKAIDRYARIVILLPLREP